MSEYVTYAHAAEPNGIRFRDIKGGKYPKWAIDIQDYVEPPTEADTITVNRTEWEAMKHQAAIGKLVLEKFVSGNTIPVSRCTISAEELALLSTDESKENEVKDENNL
jgi:hypothetical protein